MRQVRDVWAFLQQWFSLGITDDLMRQAKESEQMHTTSTPHISPAEERKSEIKGRYDRAIAMIAESITATTDTVKRMK